jgi:hypothetical protein
VTEAALNSILLVVMGAAFALATGLYLAKRTADRDHAEELAREHLATNARVAEIELKLALVNQQMVPIATAMTAMFVKELTHFHTPELDALMVKVGPPNTLTAAEVDRMSVLLEERARDMGPLITASERDAAIMLLPMIRRSQAELKVLKGAEDVKLALMTVAAIIAVPSASAVDSSRGKE